MLEIPCPCCNQRTSLYLQGTTTPEQYLRAAPYGITHGSSADISFPIYRCAACGHGTTRLTDEDEAQLLEWYTHAPRDEAYLKEERGRKITARGILGRLGRYTQPGTLLDIGCGPGFFLEEARDTGWDAYGLDCAEWAVMEAKKRGLRVTKSDVSTAQLQGLPIFDVVTAFDVLEHVRDPHIFVQQCARMLKSKGMLILTTPAFDSFAARLLRTRWHCMKPEHLHYFTLRSLHLLLERSGFRVLKHKTHTRYFTLSYLLLRLGIGDHVSSWIQNKRLIPVNIGDEWEIYVQKI